jgi:c-di-GMP-binding flagellar brake protein YcgR
MERRAHPRLACKGVGEFTILPDGPRIVGALTNLSLGGCCIVSETEIPAQPCAQVEVQLTACDIRLRLAAEVRRIDKGNVGIQFLDVSSRKEEQIQYLIDELLELEKLRTPGKDEGGGASDEQGVGIQG